jgi:hypothetical protein
VSLPDLRVVAIVALAVSIVAHRTGHGAARWTALGISGIAIVAVIIGGIA